MRTYARKSTYRRRKPARIVRRTARPSSGVRANAAGSASTIRTFVRYLAPASTSCTGAQSVSMGMNISLNQLTGISEFVSMFDQYRIVRFDVHFTMSKIASAQADGIQGWFYTLVDNDDITSSTDPADWVQYGHVKITPLVTMQTKKVVVTVKNPGVKTSVGIGQGTAVVTGGIVRSPWIDTTQTDVSHYGVKMLCQNDGPVFNMSRYTRVVFQCKGLQ